MSANLMSLARSGGKFLKLFGDRKMMKTMPTARDYVQDGLIAMWDGIENAGWGVHDASATVWKDLIGLWGDLEFVGSPAVRDDEILFNSIGGAQSSNAKTRPSSVTYEIVCNVMSGYHSVLWAATGGPYNYGDIVPFGNNTNQAELYIGGLSIKSYANDYPVFDYGKRCSMAFTSGEGFLRSFKNGSIAQEYTGERTEANFNHLSVGRYRDGHYQPISVCRIGVYERNLHPIEIAANYAIDKVRFNLPD